MNVKGQLRSNAVALVSLVLAMTSLAYNTWRNETAEAHRNVRQAAFKTLEVLGELQVIVSARQYQGDRARGDHVAGWSRVLLIDDLCSLLPPAAAGSAARLHQAWQDDFEAWYAQGDAQATRRIDAAIDAERKDVIATLRMLK